MAGDRVGTRYSRPERVAARTAALAARTIGRSREGRPIVAVEAGDDGPATLILAGIHPLEWIGVEVALAVAERAAREVPAGRRVVVVPVINVDGHAAVAGDLAVGRRRYRRTNAAGVDLNRNFGTGHVPGPVWRRSRSGRVPWSEPETGAIARLLDERPFDRAVALHSFGRMILLPWGHRGERPPRWPELLGHARAVAARLPVRYRVFQTGRLPLYRPRGLELDWLAERGLLAMLVECGDGGLRPTRPSTWVSPFDWYNPADPAEVVDGMVPALWPFVVGAG